MVLCGPGWPSVTLCAVICSRRSGMNEMNMKTRIIVGCAVLSFGLAVFGQPKILYQNDFEKAEVGQVPSDFLVLDGGFVVKEENGNKLLELPGTPLDSFAVQ